MDWTWLTFWDTTELWLIGKLYICNITLFLCHQCNTGVSCDTNEQVSSEFLLQKIILSSHSFIYLGWLWCCDKDEDVDEAVCSVNSEDVVGYEDDHDDDDQRLCDLDDEDEDDDDQDDDE